MALELTGRYGKALSRKGLRPTDAPAWIDAVDNPYLHGLFAPVCTEGVYDGLVVEGELPRDLHSGLPSFGEECRKPFAASDFDGVVVHSADGPPGGHGFWQLPLS